MLSRDEVLEIAELAQLELATDEVEAMQRELAAILAHFSALAAVDTTGVAPMAHAGRATANLRADVVEPSLAVDDALAAAPARFHDLISVPAIIKGT